MSFARRSLMDIPLVYQMVSDPSIRWVTRAMDSEWYYRGTIPIKMTGFSPFHGEIFCGANSHFFRWLETPRAEVEPNERESLVREVLSATHDFLHAWAYRAIDAIMPNLKIGRAKITENNIEDLVFCHLLTEVAAVAGLDYWYLSTVDLAAVCGLDTRIRHFAVIYDETSLHEYRKANPHFEAQSPSFFRYLSHAYCTSHFAGFDLDRPAQSGLSPKARVWLQHETAYTTFQRKYTRLWFSHLSGNRVRYPDGALTAPLKIDAPWKRALIDELGNLIWSKVKEGRVHDLGKRRGQDGDWGRNWIEHPDFRFSNWNRVPRRSAAKVLQRIAKSSPENFLYFFYQFVSRFEFKKVDPEILRSFDDLRRCRDPIQVTRSFRRQKRLLPVLGEPADLLFLE